MISYKRNNTEFTLSKSGYSFQVWKPNHCVFGKTYTDGCYVTKYMRNHDSQSGSFRNMANTWGRSLSGLTAQEFDALVDASNAHNFTLYINIGGVHFNYKNKRIDVTHRPADREKLRVALADMGAPLTAEEIQATKDKARDKKRAAAVARTAKLNAEPSQKSKALAAVAIDPLIDATNNLRVTAHAETVAREVQPVEVNHGCPVDQVEAFRAWESKQPGAVKSLKLADRIRMFLDSPVGEWEIIDNPVRIAQHKVTPEARALLVSSQKVEKLVKPTGATLRLQAFEASTGKLREPLTKIDHRLLDAPTATPPVQPLDKSALKALENSPEAKHGLAIDDIWPYRAWAKANHEVLLGLSLDKCIGRYLSQKPKKTAYSYEPHDGHVRARVSFCTLHDEHVNDFRVNERNEKNLRRAGEILPSHKAAISAAAKTMNGGSRRITLIPAPVAEPQAIELHDAHVTCYDEAIAALMEEPTQPKVVVILHDAHVIESRRRRANRVKALRRQTVREGHGAFRVQVLANFDGCAITGEAFKEIEAAHILPDCSFDDMRPENGIALCSWLHDAFDKFVISIVPETLTVFVPPRSRQWLNVHGIQIPDGKIWPLDRGALAHHFARFKEANGIEQASEEGNEKLIITLPKEVSH